jgi:hypothetical protein
VAGGFQLHLPRTSREQDSPSAPCDHRATRPSLSRQRRGTSARRAQNLQFHLPRTSREQDPPSVAAVPPGETSGRSATKLPTEHPVHPAADEPGTGIPIRFIPNERPVHPAAGEPGTGIPIRFHPQLVHGLRARLPLPRLAAWVLDLVDYPERVSAEPESPRKGIEVHGPLNLPPTMPCPDNGVPYKKIYELPLPSSPVRLRS